MRLMKIRGLDQCVKAEGSALVLESSGGNELHVILTPEEAHRIAHELQLQGELPACPCFRNSLCSLVATMISLGDVGIGSIVLDAPGHNLLSASVQVRSSTEETSVPCHTADALALAIRFRAPIFATESLDQLLEWKGNETARSPLPDDAEATPWLDMGKPDDFVR